MNQQSNLSETPASVFTPHLQTQRTLGGNTINPSSLPPAFLASITSIPTTENEIERKNFMDELTTVMQEMGKSITKMPIMGYRELDLYTFYKEVQSYGGYTQVTDKVGTWSKIWKKLGNSDTNITDASFRLKRNYEKFLLDYEYYKNPERRRDDKLGRAHKRNRHCNSPSRKPGNRDLINPKRRRFPSSETLEDFPSSGFTLSNSTAQQRITGSGVYSLGSSIFSQPHHNFSSYTLSSSAPTSIGNPLFNSSSSLSRINSFSSLPDQNSNLIEDSSFDLLEEFTTNSEMGTSISSDSLLNLSPSSELSPPSLFNPSENYYSVANNNHHNVHASNGHIARSYHHGPTSNFQENLNNTSFEDSLLSCQSLELSINDEFPHLPGTFEDEKNLTSLDLESLSWVDL